MAWVGYLSSDYFYPWKRQYNFWFLIVWAPSEVSTIIPPIWSASDRKNNANKITNNNTLKLYGLFTVGNASVGSDANFWLSI